MKQEILIVNTCQFTSKCKNDRVIAEKQQKSKTIAQIIITKHMYWALRANLVIDRFKCYSACIL